MKKKFFFCLRLVISLLLVAFFAYSADIRTLFRPIAPIGWVYLGLMFLLVNLDRILMSYKWNILLTAKGIILPFVEVVRGYYIGTFWGTFLPTTVGGDVVRAYRVAGQTNSKKDIVSSVVLERVLGIIASFLMGFSSVILFIMFVDASNWKIVASLIISFLVFLSLVLLSFNIHLIRWFDKRFLFHRQGMIGKLTQVYDSYHSYRQHHGAMLRFLLWSLLEHCSPIICTFLVSQALKLDIPWWSFFIFIPVIMALSKVPVSIDGFGVREGLYVFFFSFVGIPGSDAFLLGFVSHILGIVSVLPGFFYYSFFLTPPAKILKGSYD